MSIYQIPGPWRGTLSIVSRPRGGDWLGDEVRAWQRQALNVIVSLMTQAEQREFDLTGEESAIEEGGLRYFSLPITDMNVPASVDDAAASLREIEALLEAGKNVGIHCRQGIGRSSLVAACLLILSGMPAHEALALIEKSRGLPVPETNEQRRWVENFEIEFSPSVADAK